MKNRSSLAVALAALAMFLGSFVIGIPLLVVAVGGGGAVDDACAPPDSDPTLLGAPSLTAQDLLGWWEATGRHQPAHLGAPIGDVITLYIDEGTIEGVRGDLAFAQAVHETGWFSSSDTSRNNFAGVAHPDGARSGRPFVDVATGVRAHIQLLKKFAAGNDAHLAHEDVAPDAAARASTWPELAGTWAADPNYWTAISDVYANMRAHASRPERPTASAATCAIAVSPAAGVDLNLVNVSGITVDEAIASQLDAMITSAADDGVHLTGSGYRSHDRQIELRRAHCGTTHYAIYEMPSSQCSPPTARPGSSMHERGLAIDFDNCSTHSTACWRWLNSHATAYGFLNLPSEPWHWSTTGQ